MLRSTQTDHIWYDTNTEEFVVTDEACNELYRHKDMQTCKDVLLNYTLYLDGRVAHPIPPSLAHPNLEDLMTAPVEITPSNQGYGDLTEALADRDEDVASQDYHNQEMSHEDHMKRLDEDGAGDIPHISNEYNPKLTFMDLLNIIFKDTPANNPAADKEDPESGLFSDEPEKEYSTNHLHRVETHLRLIEVHLRNRKQVNIDTVESVSRDLIPLTKRIFRETEKP